eukprot:2650338-Alexandrium_andersonii.AAC.1
MIEPLAHKLRHALAEARDVAGVLDGGQPGELVDSEADEGLASALALLLVLGLELALLDHHLVQLDSQLAALGLDHAFSAPNVPNAPAARACATPSAAMILLNRGAQHARAIWT